MELLYVLAGGVMVVAGYVLAKIDFHAAPKKTAEKTTVEEPRIVVQDAEKDTEDPNRIPVEKQLSDMQSYDPVAAVRKKGALEE